MEPDETESGSDGDVPIRPRAPDPPQACSSGNPRSRLREGGVSQQAVDFELIADMIIKTFRKEGVVSALSLLPHLEMFTRPAG